MGHIANKRNVLFFVLIAALIGCAVLANKVRDLRTEVFELQALIDLQRSEILEKQAHLNLNVKNLEKKQEAVWQTQNGKKELRADHLLPKVPLPEASEAGEKRASSETDKMRKNIASGLFKNQYQKVFKALSLDAERQEKMLGYLTNRNQAQLDFSMLLFSDLSIEELLKKQEILATPLQVELKNILENHEIERFAIEEQDAHKQMMKKMHQGQMAQLSIDDDTREAALKAIEKVIDSTQPEPLLGQFTKEKLQSMRATYSSSKPGQAGMLNATIEEMRKRTEPVLQAADKHLPKEEFEKFKATLEMPIKMIQTTLERLDS